LAFRPPLFLDVDNRTLRSKTNNFGTVEMDVGKSRSDEGAGTDEMDADGFITVRTKREKRAIKDSNTVERNRSESSNCKSVSRGILLKQSSL
jgi:hypothetical protein